MTQQNATFLGVGPPNSNSVDIFIQCTYPPSFTIVCLIIWKLLCWQTSGCSWKHLPSLRCATPVGKNILKCVCKLHCHQGTL